MLGGSDRVEVHVHLIGPVDDRAEEAEDDRGYHDAKAGQAGPALPVDAHEGPEGSRACLPLLLAASPVRPWVRPQFGWLRPPGDHAYLTLGSATA